LWTICPALNAIFVTNSISDMPTEQRDDYLSRLNPDLATTLKALGEFE